MSATYYAENQVLKTFFGQRTPTIPSTWYVGLSTGVPTEAGVITTEFSGNNYARAAYPNAYYNFNEPTNGQLTTSAFILFNQATGTWGSAAYVLFFDALVGGNLWFWDALSTPITIVSGCAPCFSSEEFTIKNNN